MDKYEIVSAAQKNVLNPAVKAVLSRGWTIPGYALLETTGRTSGQARQTPVGEGLEGDTFWIVAEHGRRADYVRNIEENPRVRVQAAGRWRSGTAQVLDGDDPHERQNALGQHLSRRMNAAAVRAMGTDLLTVRIDLEPESENA